MRMPLVTCLLCLSALLAACGGAASVGQQAGAPTATVAPTATLPPPATSAPPTVTPLPTATPAPTATPLLPTTAPTVARPTSAPTAAATVTRPANPATAAAATPRGPVPAGWKVYTGTTLPFAMAYPPDWRADESELATRGNVVFRAPNGTAALIINSPGQRTTLTIDEVRDVAAKQAVATCVKSGTEFTARETISGIVFAELVQTCDLPNQPLSAFFLGAGLNNGVPWIFNAVGFYGEFNKNTCKCAAGNLERYFSPMLTTLSISGNP